MCQYKIWQFTKNVKTFLTLNNCFIKFLFFLWFRQHRQESPTPATMATSPTDPSVVNVTMYVTVFTIDSGTVPLPPLLPLLLGVGTCSRVQLVDREVFVGRGKGVDQLLQRNRLLTRICARSWENENRCMCEHYYITLFNLVDHKHQVVIRT